MTVGACQSSQLQQTLTNHWDTIRKVLPPSFSGKYDKERFAIFLQTNLRYLGYLGLVVGIVLMVQVGDCRPVYDARTTTCTHTHTPVPACTHPTTPSKHPTR